jgi:acyl-CoA thioester hydrolase
MQFEDYKHHIPLQIRFCDIDKLNHLNNSVYHNFFELGRVKYFNELFKDTINWDEKGFVLARTEINHILPTYLNDIIFAFTKVIKIGTKSITIKNSICKLINEKLIESANGLGILVAMDYIKNQSIELPNEWKIAIKEYENNII